MIEAPYYILKKKQYISPEHWYVLTKLHGVSIQNTEI
jgi:hypothetical protein